jgi:hypothetical protein
MGADGLPVYSLNDPELDSSFAGELFPANFVTLMFQVMMKYKFKKIFL